MGNIDTIRRLRFAKSTYSQHILKIASGNLLDVARGMDLVKILLLGYVDGDGDVVLGLGRYGQMGR